LFNTKCEFKTMTSIKSLTLLFLLLAISMVSCTRYSNIPRQRQWFKTIDKSEKQTEVVNEINSKKEVKNEAIAVVELPSIIEPSKADYSSETTSKTMPQISLLPYTKEIGQAKIKTLIKINQLSKNFEKHIDRAKIESKNSVKIDEEEPEEELEFNVLSAVSLASGLIAWGSIVAYFIYQFFFLDFLIPISVIFAIVAIITGSIALRQTGRQPQKYSNRYMAWIGWSMGILEFIGPILVGLALLWFFEFM
jgi:hypothetical protein